LSIEKLNEEKYAKQKRGRAGHRNSRNIFRKKKG
jgi:hypothetical protein